MSYESILPLLAIGGAGLLLASSNASTVQACSPGPCAPTCGNNESPLTDAQLAQLSQANFGSQAAIMMAIAIAESTGYPNAYNCSCCYGLWQINAAANGYSDPTVLYNPATNAAAAAAILSSQGLSAWDRYTDGTYQMYLSRAALALNAQNTQLLSFQTSPVGACIVAPCIAGYITLPNLCPGCESCFNGQIQDWGCCAGDGDSVQAGDGTFAGCCPSGGTFDPVDGVCVAVAGATGICAPGYALDPTGTFCVQTQ